MLSYSTCLSIFFTFTEFPYFENYTLDQGRTKMSNATIWDPRKGELKFEFMKFEIWLIDLLFFQHSWNNGSQSTGEEAQMNISDPSVKSDLQPSSFGFDSEEYQLAKIIKTEQKVCFHPKPFLSSAWACNVELACLVFWAWKSLACQTKAWLGLQAKIACLC